MQQVKIRRSLGTAWNAFTKRGWYLTGLTSSFIILFVFSVGNAVITALAYIAFAGYVTVMLRHFRGEYIRFDDMFSLDSRWISFAFVGLIKGLLITLGLIFFIFPGVYLAIKWMFAELLIIDKGFRPLESLRGSWTLTNGHGWKLLLYSGVISVLMFLSLFVFVVGIIPAAAWVFLSTIAIYEELKNKLDQPTPMPTENLA